VKPMARYAALSGYLELSQSLGIEPIPLMRAAGVDPSGLMTQDARLPAESIARLLEDTAAASGCEDFGVRLAARRQLSNLGPLSLVLREEPDVRSAINLLIRYEQSYNESLRLRMHERDEVATITVAFAFGTDLPCRQAQELVVGVLHGILREFLGSAWQPFSVCFPHPSPAEVSSYQHYFGQAPHFDQPFTGLVLSCSDLDAPNQMSDPTLREYAWQYLRSWATPNDDNTAAGVLELIEVLLPAGRCSLEEVAHNLRVSSRTLQRQLEASGETFSRLLDTKRAELAERYLLHGRYSLTEISLLLGFAGLSGFSRWFREQYECSPSAWRANSTAARL